MFSKWKFNHSSLKGFVIGEDKNIYRLPYTVGKRSYNLRKIKKQYGNRYKINNEWWSIKRLRDYIIPDDDPIELIKSDNPF